MPEGPTLHRLARLHNMRFGGEAVRASSPQGRFAAEASRIDGRTFESAEAWGKHLVHRYGGGLNVHIHLGLYGAFTEQAMPMAAPVGQVRLRMEGSAFGTDLRGPNVCELLDEAQVDALIAALGPDPLREDADPLDAFDRLRRSRAGIGALLMNQQVVAGIGNVYRAELLFRHRISPWLPGSAVGREQWLALWDDIAALMRVAVERGQLITIEGEHDHGAPPYQPGRPRSYVYRRAGESCRLCGTPVAHAVLQGRNLFWCPSCQPA
jgi:endonuclease-8